MKKRQIVYILASVFIFLVSFSCNDEDISKITAIKLTASHAQLLINEEFNFEVKANNLDVITGQAVIKVDGVTINDAFFSSEEPGDFEVQAFYEDFESNVVLINTVYPSGFIQNVLVEDYTGTWCVNCPRVSYGIEQAKSQSDKVVSVGIHAFDAMQMTGFNVLTDIFNPFGEYPKGKLNRINEWENPDVNIEAVTELTGFGAPIGLSIDSDIDGTNINATIEVGFDEDSSTPTNVVVYLVENGLVAPQANSTPYYGGPGTVDDFEHNDVLRAIGTHHLGDAIPAAATTADNVYSFVLQIAIPASVENNNELHIVAFVTDANTNEVMNVREAAVGAEQDLQEL